MRAGSGSGGHGRGALAWRGTAAALAGLFVCAASSAATQTQPSGKPPATAPVATAPAPAPGAAAEVGLRARIEPAAARAEIGEPVRWVLSIEHPSSTRVTALPPETDLGWLVLGEPRIARAPAGDGRATTRVEWTIAALEPGTRALPAPSVEVEADGQSFRVLAESASIEVVPALAEGEDAPRPMRGFRPPPQGAQPSPRWPWFAAAAALAALALVWRRRRRRAPAPLLPPAPLEVLAGLETRLQAEPESAREIVFAASRLARDAVDAALGESRAALTDEDWGARTRADERLPEGVRAAGARLLDGFERAKYALEVPTRFALAERLLDLRGLLEALPPPGAPVARKNVAVERGEAA